MLYRTRKVFFPRPAGKYGDEVSNTKELAMIEECKLRYSLLPLRAGHQGKRGAVKVIERFD